MKASLDEVKQSVDDQTVVLKELKEAVDSQLNRAVALMADCVAVLERIEKKLDGNPR